MGRARLVVAAHGGDARAALWEAVEGAKGGDLLAPVTVAVPSTYAGLGLRRELGRRRGLVNVRFVALARVAEALGAPDLAAAGRRPLTPPLRTEAIHATLVADPGPLAGVAEHPSTEAALAASFADLRRAPDGARRRLGARGGRVGAITRLYEQFRDRTRDFYDEEDLTLAATTAVERAPERLADVGHVVVHLPHSLSPGEEELLLALARRDAVTVVLGLTGDPEVDAAETGGLVTRLSPGLGAPERTGAGTPPAPPLGTGAVSAPDPEDEVRAVVTARRRARRARHAAAPDRDPDPRRRAVRAPRARAARRRRRRLERIGTPPARRHDRRASAAAACSTSPSTTWRAMRSRRGWPRARSSTRPTAGPSTRPAGTSSRARPASSAAPTSGPNASPTMSRRSRRRSPATSTPT